MDSKSYKKIRDLYDEKREKKIEEARRKKEKVFNENEKLSALEEKRNLLALKMSKNIMNYEGLEKQIEQENMEIKLKKIDEKIENELKKIGFSKEDFYPKFDCKICKDTGIVKKDGKDIYCSCFIQAVINETYKQINILKFDEENFETFDSGYYSNKVDVQKYGIKKSPKENIENIKEACFKFANNITDKKEKSLLFIGNTGLGKTFLSNAIAKKVLDDGKSVIYQTAPIFMDKIMQYKFSYEDESRQLYDRIFDVDLLIIDDLGTETMTNNKYTELFNIINSRLLKNKKIIISTNLTLNELFERYDERIVSRLIGEFRIFKFIGDDIRLKKKRIHKEM